MMRWMIAFLLATTLPVTVFSAPATQELLALQDGDPQPKPPGYRQPVPSLYHSRYSEQTFIGAHDCAAIRTADNGWSLSGNQYFSVKIQLDAGVRLLQAQGHRDPGGSHEIHLCHYNCALMDGGNLTAHLLTVKRFLETHPHEVVTLLFVNTLGSSTLSTWAQAYYNTGLDLMSYTAPRWKRHGFMRIEDWPTIAEMVATNKRLVTFLSSGADEEAVPYLLNQFDYMFETDFGIEALDQFSCTPSRPRFWDPSYIPPRLSLVNHFLYAKFLGFRYPNASAAAYVNGAGFHTGQLGEHAARCKGTHERRPNFLLVDFFNEGSVFDVEYGMNKY